jgi:hypothetical protein
MIHRITRELFRRRTREIHVCPQVRRLLRPRDLSQIAFLKIARRQLILCLGIPSNGMAPLHCLTIDSPLVHRSSQEVTGSAGWNVGWTGWSADRSA